MTSYKKVNNLYEKVKDYVLYIRDLDETSYRKETGRYHKSLTREGLAKKFKVKPHEIGQCFQKLNLEGILAQPVKRRHDDWTPDIYYFKFPLDTWFDSIYRKDMDKIKRLLEKGMDINSSDNSRSTLKTAVLTKDIKLISFLLENGAKPLFSDFLFLFSFKNQDKSMEIYELFLDYTEDLFMKDSNGETLLFPACRNYSEFVLPLLKRGLKTEEKNNLGQTPLMVAIENKQINSMRYLFLYKANFKAKDDNKKSVFMYAYELGDKNSLKFFIPIRHSLTKDEKKLFKKIRMRILF